MAPSWSTDAKQIAFESLRDGNREIYTMNADGTASSRRTISPALDISPSWAR
jgi:TolB protein